MGGPGSGRKRLPAEVKRRRGTLRGTPRLGELVALPSVDAPEPHRPLGRVGQQFWERAWADGHHWLAQTDREVLLLVAEQLDERVALRIQVFSGGDWRARLALRQLDAVILNGLGALGFTPADRGRLGVAEVTRVSKLDALRRRPHPA